MPTFPILLNEWEWKMNNEWYIQVHYTIVLWVAFWDKKKRKAVSTIVSYDVNAEWKIQLTYWNKAVFKPTCSAEDPSTGFTSTLCVFVDVYCYPSVCMRHMVGSGRKRSILISWRLKLWSEVNFKDSPALCQERLRNDCPIPSSLHVCHGAHANHSLFQH